MSTVVGLHSAILSLYDIFAVAVGRSCSKDICTMKCIKVNILYIYVCKGMSRSVAGGISILKYV